MGTNMKILLVAINAKYIHSNLAVYTLRAYAKKQGIDIDIEEYTINNYKDEIMADIYKKKPDFIGFSCYIWNIEYVEDISRELKKVLPDTHIWYGGPEVSFNSEDYLKSHSYVDGIMIGEGEETICKLIRYYNSIKDRTNNCDIENDIDKLKECDICATTNISAGNKQNDMKVTVPVGEHYQITGVKSWEIKNGENYVVISGNEKLQAGKTYRVMLNFSPTDDYLFAAQIATAPLKVNGNYVSREYDSSTETVKKSCPFAGSVPYPRSAAFRITVSVK